MFGGTGKRAFVRTDIPLRERLIGGFILLLLVGVGAGVFHKGQHFDPALFSLDPQFLDAGQPARTPAPLIAEEGEDRAGSRPAPVVPLAGPAPLPAAPVKATPAGSWWANLAPPGWKPQGEAEHFAPDNLYVKINGRAEQYLAYEVAGLECAGVVEDKGGFIDIFVYDMGTSLRAYGIFSVERPPEAAALDLGREGYKSGASFFFWQGRHYVQVVAGGEGEVFEQAGLLIARQVAGRLEDRGERIWGKEALPAAGQVQGSLQYFMRDALSLDFLGETFVARYREGGRELTVFLSRQETPGAAAQVLGKYLEYLKGYGAVEEGKDTPVHLGDLGGFYDAVFSQGRYVGGVSQAEDRDLALGWAERLAGQMANTED